MKKNILNTGSILILFFSVTALNSLDTQNNICNLNDNNNESDATNKALSNESDIDDHDDDLTLSQMMGECAKKTSELYDYIDNTIEKTITYPFLSKEREYKLNDPMDAIFKLFNIVEDEYEKFIRDICIALYDEESFLNTNDWFNFEASMNPLGIKPSSQTLEESIAKAVEFQAVLNFNEMFDHINMIIKKHIGVNTLPVPKTKYTADLARLDIDIQKKKADMIQHISVLLYEIHVSNNLIKLYIDILKEVKKGIDYFEIEANAKGDQEKIDMHEFQLRFVAINQAICKNSMVIAKNYLILQKYNSILNQEDINNIFGNILNMIDNNIADSQILRDLDPTKIEKFFDVKKGHIRKDLHDSWWPIDIKGHFMIDSKSNNNNKLDYKPALMCSTNLKKMKHWLWRHAKHGDSFILDEEHKAMRNFHETYRKIIDQLNDAQKLSQEVALKEKFYHENKRLFEGALDDNVNYKKCAISYIESKEAMAKLGEVKFQLFHYIVDLLAKSSDMFDETLPLKD